MKITALSGIGKIVLGIIIGAMLFSGTSVAYNNYVSDNTPENGYLLCANNKTKILTFPNKLSCPSGSRALDLGAVIGEQGPPGPAGLTGQTNLVVRPKNALSTFASVSLPAGTSNYSAILPVRAKAFASSNVWHQIKVDMRISGNMGAGTVQCQVMPMDSFTGTQTSGTSVGSTFLIFQKLSLTQEFSGAFKYYGGDYVLACKSDVAATVNASVVVQETDPLNYLG